MSDLPEMYAQSLRAQPKDCGHTFQANHKCPCYSYYVTIPRLIALMPIRVCPLECIPERSDYGYAASNIVATIVNHRKSSRSNFCMISCCLKSNHSVY